MALQDVCGFLNPSCDIQCLWSKSEGRSFSIGSSGSRRRQETRNKSPLEFYVPVHEYLTQSPISFGQVQPSLSRSSRTFKTTADQFPPSLSASSSVPLPFPLGHGTTTLGFVFQGGVIAAADTRSSCAGLVACPASQKIIPVHSHLVGTTSGTSADCCVWKRVLTREMRLYQLRNKRRLSTEGAAKLLSHMLHPFKGTELCVAATLCGWDRDEMVPGASDRGAKTQATDVAATSRSGPALVYVCSDGLRLKGELFSVGSGSPYAYSVLDDRSHWGMSVEEAVSVAREAVYRATHRDAYSGNSVDLYHITANGWTRRKREDLKEEYYRERERERGRMEDRKREGEGGGITS